MYLRRTARLSGLLILALSWGSLVRAGSLPSDAAAPSGRDFPGEPFVIESMKTSFRFETDGTSSRSVRMRVRLQTEGALQQFGQLVLGYASDTERLAFTGRVIKPDGTSEEIPATAVQDVSSPILRIAPMYTDIRQKHVIVPGLHTGDVLEYEVRSDQFASPAPGQFWAAYDFSRAFIVKDEELQVDVPLDKYVNVKSRPGLKPEVTEKGGRRVYTWETSNLQREDDSAGKKDKGGPPDLPDPPAVQVTTFRSWAEVGDWYASLAAGRQAPDGAVSAKAQELTRGMTDDAEKLRAIYRFVAQEFRYVSLSFGMGRYQPHAAGDVFANRYGDCKDKHTLLAAMAGAAGLQVLPVLSSLTRKIDPELPSPQQFDHLLSRARIGTREIWLDSTTELAPFGLLLPQERGKHVLVVEAGGKSEMRETPADPAVENTQVITVEGSLDDLGALDADVRLSFRGDGELMGRLAARAIPQAKWKDLMKALVDASGVEGDVSAAEISEVTDTEHPLEYRFHLAARNFFNRFGKDSKLELPFGQIALLDPDDVKEGEPLKVGPSRSEYHMKLRLPPGFRASLPVPVDLSRDYGRYSSRYALDGSTLAADRVLSLKVGELPAGRRDDFQAFRSTVTADAGQTVAVKVEEAAGTPGGPNAKTDELLKAADAAYDSGEYQAAAEILARVVKMEPGHKSAYNDLGRAYIALRRWDEAEAALKKAVELNPYSPYAYNNLGRVHWARKRYEEAEKDFRKQIEIVPLDEWAHRNLGTMLEEQEKYAEAEPELEKAVAIDSESSRPFVALGEAQINLGEQEKGLESFSRAVAISPSPLVWNDIAYVLAEHKLRLDLAQQYAESAVTMVTALLRNTRLDSLKPEELVSVQLLAVCWDTLGWVHFQKGEASAAIRYLNAAWELAQESASADHLGQAYESQGKKDLAIEYYSLAAAERDPGKAGWKHLVALAGPEKARSSLDGKGERLGELRTYAVPGATGNGNADFFVVLAPGPRVAGVRFASGDERMKPLGEALKSIPFKMDFPDEGGARVVRRGILSCGDARKKSAKGPCTFVLLNPTDAGPIEESPAPSRGPSSSKP